MKQLPSEVLSHIFSFLDISSKKDAACVCRLWYSASLHPKLMQGTKFTFDITELSDKNCQRKELLGDLICKSPNVCIVGLDENFNSRLFINLHKEGMQILGKHVEHLSLKHSNILDGTLMEILRLCENLQGLDLTGCNAMFMSGVQPFTGNSSSPEVVQILRDLTTLNLSSLHYLNDIILTRFMKLCPSIQSLTLASNNILYSFVGLSKSNCLNFSTLTHHICGNPSHLTHINLSRTSITSEALSGLACINGLRLKEVIIQNCRSLTDHGVMDLAKHQSAVEFLDMSGCAEIGNASVAAVCNGMSNLAVLKLKRCPKITGFSIKQLNLLQKLRELDISECPQIDMASLRTGIGHLVSLRAIQLKCCNFSGFSISFSQPSLERTSINLSSLSCSLRHLDIGSSKYLDDAALQTICIHFINIEVLKMNWSSAITDAGLLGLPHQVLSQQEKFLSSSKYTSSHGYAGLIDGPVDEFKECEEPSYSDKEIVEFMKERGLIRLQHLRQLSMANCPKITSNCLSHIFRYENFNPFPCLEKLDLGMLRAAVTNDNVIAITKACPRLTDLSIAFCSLVTDDFLRFMILGMNNLMHLNLSSCDSITEQSLIDVSSICRWLQELDISMCRRISASAVKKLKQTLPGLSRLHTRYSGGASLDISL